MKRFISILTIVAILICSCISVGAASVYKYGDWTLTALNTDGGVAFAVRSYDGSDAVVTVPNDYGGYPIIAINNYAFAGNDTIKKLTIGDNITAIGEDAFTKSDNVVIYGTADSYAVEYAKEHEIDYIRTNVVTYILGDADGDGVITAVDATLVLRYLVKLSVPNVEIVERNGDIDGEGLDITDATLILRHVIGADVPYPVGSLVEQIL